MTGKFIGGLALSAIIILMPVKAGEQYTDNTADEEIRENMPAEAEKYMGSDDNASGTIIRMLETIPELMLGELKSGIKDAAVIIAISALMATVKPAAVNAETEKALNIAGVAAVTAIAVGGMKSIINICMETALKLTDWSALVLPVMASASAAAGGVGSAAAKYTAASIGMSVVSKIASDAAVPLTYGFIALSVGAAAFGGGTLKSAGKLVKCASKWVLTLTATALTIYLMLSGATAVSADAVAVKSVKTIINTLPIVGGIASDAASAVLAGAGVIKNSAGILGIIGVLGLCIGPVIRIASRILLFKVSGALAASFDGGISPLMDDFASALGIGLATCGLAALLLFFSIVSFMQGVQM